MAKQQSVAGKRSRSTRDEDIARYEKQLAAYLQERIKPGLNPGSIPLVVRSIAKDIAHQEHPNGSSADAEPEGTTAAERMTPDDFEAAMREFQAELGDDWIVHFSVHGEDAWLTAERADGSQHLEAQTTAALRRAIKLLNKDGGRSG